MPNLEANPRPNYRIRRGCGNCKWLLTDPIKTNFGYCTLPLGPSLKKTELRKHVDEFKETHYLSICENHQWKSKGHIKKLIKRTGVRFDGEL